MSTNNNLTIVVQMCTTEPVEIPKPKGRCLASGLYIHMNQDQIILNNPVLENGDYYWDVDFGLFVWDGEKFT